MSAADCPASEDALCEFPSFDLCAQVDDADDPDAVTLFPDDADERTLLTTWLTVDADAAVPLADAR